MHKHAIALALVPGMVMAGGSALAQSAPGATVPANESMVEEIPTETRWYGYQVMLADVASWLVMPFQPALGVGSLYLGGPVVHALNGEPGNAWASGGLRIGLTLGGAVLGAAIAPEDQCEEYCFVSGQLLYGVFGGLIGLGAAQIIDWTVLSKKTVVKEGYSFAPTASVTPQGVNIGLAGRF